jgi:hypothetical protein
MDEDMEMVSDVAESSYQAQQSYSQLNGLDGHKMLYVV